MLVCKSGRAYISDFGLSTLLTELGGSSFATSVHERGTLRWTAPELFDLEISEDEVEPSKVMPTKHSDVYSFGGVMLQVRGSPSSMRILIYVSRGTDSDWEGALPLLYSRDTSRTRNF